MDSDRRKKKERNRVSYIFFSEPLTVKTSNKFSGTVATYSMLFKKKKKNLKKKKKKRRKREKKSPSTAPRYPQVSQ